MSLDNKFKLTPVWELGSCVGFGWEVTHSSD